MKFDMDELRSKSAPDLIDIALECEEGPKFWYVAGLVAGMTDPMNGPITRALLKAGRAWDYQAAYRAIAKLKCRHERLNEDGICRACGADCRGIGI